MATDTGDTTMEEIEMASTFVPPRFNSGTRYDPRFSE